MAPSAPRASSSPSFQPPPSSASLPPQSAPSHPSAASFPPQSPPSAPADPFAPAPNPFSPGAAGREPVAPEGLRPAAPAGMVQKGKPGGGFGGSKTFAGTIMGTMVFLAKSKSVPLAAKIGGVVILVGALAATSVVLLQMRSRDQARQALDAALALPEGEGVTRVRELLAEGLDDESELRAIAFLGEHHDGQAVGLLTEELDGSLEVQRAAAGALAEIGPPDAQPAMTALGGLLDAEDTTLRSRAAWALARLGDGRGLDALIAAVAAGDAPSLPSYDPGALADLMGREGLLAALSNESGTVRQFAAYHLGEVCQAGDEQAITSAAQDADAAVASTAVVTLARCGMSSAPAQVAAMLSRDPTRWNTLYSQMHHDVGAPGLGMLLPHAPDAGTRRALIDELESSGDPRASDVLVAALQGEERPSARDRMKTAEALAAASDPRLVEVLAPMLESDDADRVRTAIALLGRTAAPETVEERLRTIATGSSELRVAALDAMAAAGVCGEDTQRVVQRWLFSRQTKTSALRMLGRCGNERAVEMARREVGEPLATPITEEQGLYRLAALDVVASGESADVAPALVAQLEEPTTDPRIRVAIADTLGVIAPEGTRDHVLDVMLDERAPRAVRSAAFRLLRHGVAPSSVARLMGFVRGGEDDERTGRSAVLLGLFATPESRTELAQLLGDDRAKAQAAVALALGADDAAAEALAALIHEDEDVATSNGRALADPPWLFPAADRTALQRAIAGPALQPRGGLRRALLEALRGARCGVAGGDPPARPAPAPPRAAPGSDRGRRRAHPPASGGGAGLHRRARRRALCSRPRRARCAGSDTRAGRRPRFGQRELKSRRSPIGNAARGAYGGVPPRGRDEAARAAPARGRPRLSIAGAPGSRRPGPTSGGVPIQRRRLASARAGVRD